MDSDLRDLVTAVSEYFEDEADSLNLLKTLAEKFNNQELEEAAKEYAEEVGLCYECEIELVVEEWEENRPFGDTYAEEKLAKRVCLECGYEI